MTTPGCILVEMELALKAAMTHGDETDDGRSDAGSDEIRKRWK